MRICHVRLPRARLLLHMLIIRHEYHLHAPRSNLELGILKDNWKNWLLLVLERVVFHCRSGILPRSVLRHGLALQFGHHGVQVPKGVGHGQGIHFAASTFARLQRRLEIVAGDLHR